MKKTPLLFPLFGLASMAASTAMAAETGIDAKQAELELEHVTVYGAAYRSTGTKSSLRPIEAPVSYEIYDGEILDLRQVDSVNEALRYVPGVTAESRATVTIFDQYTIRGFTTYRNFYNGLPLQYNGLWNLVPQVDAFASESIEILKGPTSVLYGSAPPGGMVNQIAKQPRSETSTSVRARIGDDDLREIGLETTGAITDTVDVMLVALARQKDGQQKTTEEERRLLAPSLTWTPTDDTSLNINLYYQDDPEMIPSTPLPSLGTVYRASYGKLDADAYSGDTGWSGYDREVTMIGYQFTHRFNDTVEFLQNARHTSAEALQKNMYNYGLAADGRTLIRSAYFTDEENRGFTVDNQLSFEFDTGDIGHRLLVGIDHDHMESDIRYGDTFGVDTPTIDLGNPNNSVVVASALPLDTYQQTNDIEQTQTGFYIQEELFYKDLTIVAGLRRDDYESTDKNINTYGASTTEIDQSETSARLAAIYRLPNGVSPYLSYAESFEPTSGTDTNTGKAFEPTTADQIEAGIKYESDDGATQITATVFDLRKENVVVNTADFLEYTQNGEVRSTGAELTIAQRVNEAFDLTANFSTMDVRVTDNPLNTSLEGKTPVQVAGRQASVWANYAINPQLKLSTGLRYVGKSQIDAANTDTVPSYTVVDLALMYQMNETWRLGLTINNLADRRYTNACSNTNNCWMGADRSVEMSVYADF